MIELRPGVKIRVYGYTNSGRLHVEGDAHLVKPDRTFDRHQGPLELRDNQSLIRRDLRRPALKPQRGPFLRWLVRFEGQENRRAISRWVRARDVLAERTLEPPD